MNGPRPTSPSASLRTAFDVALAVWAVAWVILGFVVAGQVRNLADLGDTVVEAGGAIQQSGRALGALSALPIVGGALADQASRIEAAGASAQRSGASARDSVQGLSVLLGLAVAVVPSGPLLLLYLPWRLAGLRERRAVRDALLSGDDPALQELLARRAVERLPYDRLREVSRDPWGDLGAGRYERLAAAELERLGLAQSPG